MFLTCKFKLSNAVLAGVLLALAVSSQAQNVVPAPGPGANLLADPGFNGQTPTFQSTDGPYAWGWAYTPGYDFFSSPGYLVSQSLATSDLYYYNIDFALNTHSTDPGADFVVLWDHSIVTPIWNLNPSDAWVNYSFQVTAYGSSSEIGLLGNSTFWADMSGLDVYWTGFIDPPPYVAPDSPIGFGFEAAALLGLCGAAGLYRRPELRFALRKAA